MFAFVDPFMPNYNFIPPSKYQFLNSGFSCGGFGFTLPFMNTSLFSYNTPFMNFYNPFSMPTINYSLDNFFNFGYGFNYDFNNFNTNLYNPYQFLPQPGYNINQRQTNPIDNKTPSIPKNTSENIKQNAKKLGPKFVSKVKEISKRLNCNHEDLIAVMISESSLNPKAVNPVSNATGLIQFMPSTAKAMGTTVEKIKKMSAEEQLVLVERYLTDRKREAGFLPNHKLSAGELYALIFLPGRANREILCSKNETGSNGKKLNYYEHNKGLDTNKDGMITKTELNNRIAAKRVSDSIFS